jgi:hypothetical protein
MEILNAMTKGAITHLIVCLCLKLFLKAHDVVNDTKCHV